MNAILIIILLFLLFGGGGGYYGYSHYGTPGLGGALVLALIVILALWFTGIIRTTRP